MSGNFEALPGGGAAVSLDEVEVSILRSLAVQMLELIGPGDEPAEGEDPLAALFQDGPSEPPSDPALARLFPDAYGKPGAEAADEDPELRAASAEFRRFTENDLRARKREDALAVVRSLDGLVHDGRAGGRLELTAEESRHWLGALNDLRLTIGTRLDVTDEDEGSGLYRLPDGDPRKPMVMAYLWLGILQETLIDTLIS
ncbi:DUF2017 domain-containing protein [Streptomyces sp. CC228A]|uniref:DUF2017 domain-containing protein n=1 Tax=Streptomyces sp. CC228A TaxID=2898186 RepID=UPI001F26B483|nr:DUF2017 domain-containing protein [Streptomyces sp. CC228A]